jgi:hypothetical protein
MMSMPQPPTQSPPTPASLTADRALILTFHRTTGTAAQQAAALQLGSMMCWTAAMHVAVAAGGIQTAGHVQATNFNQMFPQFNEVTSAQQAMALPLGCFVGFTDATGNTLRHVMIHVGLGWAAGTNNGSMFPNNIVGGWQLINIARFFGSAPHGQGGSRMIYRRIDGTGL